MRLDALQEPAYTADNRRPRRLAVPSQAGGVWRSRLLVGLLAASLAACSGPAIQATTVTASPPVASPTAHPTLTAVPSPTPRVGAPTPSCTQSAGRIIVGQAADATGRLLTYRVYTPPCFTIGSTPLPLLILFHGLTATDSQWADLGVGTQADALIRAGQVPPFLILMPREDTGLDLESSVMDKLMPLIEATYHVGGSRNLRAIGGLSRGAGWAMRIGFKHPDQFGAIGMDSPAVLSPDLFYLPSWTKAIPPSLMPRLSIDIGQDDTLLPATRDLTSLLDSLDVKYDWQLNPGEHTRAYWAEHLPEYLRWYAAGWPLVVAPDRRPTPTIDCGCN